MEKGRNQSTPPHETSTQSPIYLDSAFKQLLRQQHKSIALKNRTKVLNLNQQHILRLVQNHQNKITQLSTIKDWHGHQSELISKDREKKNRIMQEQRIDNEQKRIRHERQMTNINLGRNEERDRIKEEAMRMRLQNNKLIEANREVELQKKREIRNKIHEDIMESRTTIKNFFVQKHESIVQQTQEEIKKLNKRRIKEQLASMIGQGRTVVKMEENMKELKENLRASRIGFEIDRKQSSSANKKAQIEQTHPLVRKIEHVMDRYTKFL